MNTLTLIASAISIFSFVFIGFIAGAKGWTSSETAAWIQSLGSISAIAAAFAVVNLQRKMALNDSKKSETIKMQNLSAIAEDAVQAIKESSRIFENGSTPIDSHTARLKDSQFLLRKSALIFIDHKIEFCILQILRDVSRCIQDLEQFDRIFPCDEIAKLIDKNRFLEIPQERKIQYVDRINRTEQRLDEINKTLQ